MFYLNNKKKFLQKILLTEKMKTKNLLKPKQIWVWTKSEQNSNFRWLFLSKNLLGIFLFVMHFDKRLRPHTPHRRCVHRPACFRIEGPSLNWLASESRSKNDLPDSQISLPIRAQCSIQNRPLFKNYKKKTQEYKNSDQNIADLLRWASFLTYIGPKKLENCEQNRT